MYITIDLLQKRGACQQGLDFFAKYYPDGVEMLQIIEKGHLPDSFYHWGYQYLDPNKEEVAAYWKKMDVKDSQGVHESTHISGSEIVTGSTDVTNSSEVYDSKHVEQSNYVVNSEFVQHSSNVCNSCFVHGSEDVILSKNVENSGHIFDSVYVVKSFGVYESSNILNSTAVWKSENLTSCGFCFGCHNLKSALFCEGLSDGEYMVFNKPIDQERFNIVKRQFDYFAPKISFVTEWKHKFGETPKVNHDYRKHLANIPASFWEWVKTLPGYEPSIIYSLTFDPQFLN